LRLRKRIVVVCAEGEAPFGASLPRSESAFRPDRVGGCLMRGLKGWAEMHRDDVLANRSTYDARTT
jgi:hypothetical protein